MRPTLAFSLLAILALCSAAMMRAGVQDGSFDATAWSAAVFVVFAVILGWILSRPGSLNDRATDVAERQLSALRRTGQVSALVYAWGALALLAMYKFAGLYWQHGLQYACGMLLLASIIFSWTRMSRPGARYATAEGTQKAAMLNLVHGGAAAVAAVIFLASGKFWVPRPDWAANIVFLAGGFAIVSLCTIAALTYLRIGREA